MIKNNFVFLQPQHGPRPRASNNPEKKRKKKRKEKNGSPTAAGE